MTSMLTDEHRADATAPETRPDPVHHSHAEAATSALLCLYQHRLLSTSQLHRLILPNSNPRGTYLGRQLRHLREEGLVGATRASAWNGGMLWWLTPDGADVVEASREVPMRSYRMSAAKAAGPVQRHTLAVNEVGLTLVEYARAHDHTCGPLDWTPEVFHRVSDSANGRSEDTFLIVDAVMHYAARRVNGTVVQTRLFVELDRATMTVARLADKLLTYARYYNYSPGEARGGPRTIGQASARAWRSRYPRFPKVVVVLTGAGDNALLRRMDDLRAQCHGAEALADLTGKITILVTTLSQLQHEGPFAPIFSPMLGSEPGLVPLLNLDL